ncbi:RING finger protein 151-like [Coturnix japonica]|uniref:RING finger protein 151-like n=1 Tax=Coturnix japonica TaxID=93934 RepID=UPI00077709B6|nr:RING finger protein 151-like [Coturnix japonica]
MEEQFCAICRDARPDTYVVPCEHHFCLRCILQWTLRKFTCPLCRRLMSTIHFAVRADGSLPCVITLPSEYEAESHDTASLWDVAAPHPAPSGSPTEHGEEELPGTSHTAPRDADAGPSLTPVPGEEHEPQREAAAAPSAQACSSSPQREAAAAPSAQACSSSSSSPTAAQRGRDGLARRSGRPRKRRARSSWSTSQPRKKPPPRHH